MKRKIACMFMALMLVISLLPMGVIHTNAASYWAPSENVVSLIKQFEGFRASAYWDVNQWTIGYGTTGYSGQTISEAEADMVLRSKLQTINEKINQFAATNNLYLTQYQHDALVSFSFNCGTDWTTQGGRFFDAVTRNAGINEFLFAISLWANIGSTPDANLLNRRMSEANLYLNGIYSKTAPSTFTYTIFDPNGGVPGSNGEDKMQGYVAGTNAQILVGNPTRTGYSFGGWFTAPSGGTSVKYLTNNTAGRTVYAQYGVPVTVSGVTTVYSGAGTGYTTVGTISSGSQVVIVETTQSNNVTWGRFTEGWISLQNTTYGQGGTVPQQTTTTTTTNTGVVTGTNVNVRSGAGTNNPVVGSAYNGQRVTVYEVVNVNGANWGRIGDNRWISLQYVRMDTTTTTTTTTPSTSTGVIWDNGNSNSGANTTPNVPTVPTTTPTTNNTSYTMGTVTATGLNVRSGAGVGYPIVGSLPKGAQVKIYTQVTKDNALWGQTDNGWICLNYVSMAINSNPSSDGSAIATGHVNSNTAVNVRSGAGIAAPRVGSLSAGTPVSIYEKMTVNGMEWGRIGNNQWICLAYVTLTANGNGTNTNTNTNTNVGTGISFPASGTTGTVISSTNLNVRNGAGGNYAKVGSLTPGSVVSIYELVTNGNQQWGRIGTNQWVCMTYVRVNGTTSGSTPTNTIPSTGVTGKVTSQGSLNVRAAAGTNNAIIGKLASGSAVTIYEIVNLNGTNWGRIANNGWVCMNYVSLTGSTIAGTVVWQ